MKTIVKEKETKKLEFPCLMKANDGVVVLFLDREIGTVITNNTPWRLGCHLKDWDMAEFTPFEGEIILSND